MTRENTIRTRRVRAVVTVNVAIATALVIGQTQDEGPPYEEGDEVQLIAQTNLVQNGLYTVTNGAPRRSYEGDKPVEVLNTQVVSAYGALAGLPVASTSNPDARPGTDPLTFAPAQRGGAIIVNANGSGLLKISQTQSQYGVLQFMGATSANRDVEVPQHMTGSFSVINNTGHTLSFKTPSQVAGVAVATLKRALLAVDGDQVFRISADA